MRHDREQLGCARQTITVPTVGANTGFTAVQTYNYDSLNRLKDATENVTPHGGSQTQSWKQTFLFDRYGNRNFDEANTTFTGFDKLCSGNTELCADLRKRLNPSINVSNNRLNTSEDYTFDNSGNTISDPDDRTFIYDAENKQVKVLDDQEDPIGQYWYDGDGKRVKKHVPSTGETTVFVYDAAGKLIEEYSTIVETTNAKVAYLTNDHLGSPRINTDANGAVAARHDYHPFGEEIATSQRTVGLGYADDTVRKQFTGYERDNESDLDFAEARMYSFNHGRFTAVDPLMASGSPIRPQSWNRYTYSYNNPLRYTDPSGMIAGDFYNLDGKKIGTDGIDDKKIHIVYDEKKAKEIEKTKGNYTGTVDAKITLPGVNIVTAVNEAVNRSDAATFDKSGFTLEKNQTENGGGFREAGITWDKDGKVTVEPDGPYADPRKENAGMIITPNTEGSAHVHPSGVITTTTRVIATDAAGSTGPGTATRRDFIQSGPSAPVDYDKAAKSVNIVVGGSGNKRSVTFYNKNGDLATMSYKNFKKLGGR